MACEEEENNKSNVALILRAFKKSFADNAE
jgi:hypothetical protein